MKTLIVYYSRTGANERVAKALQEKLGCDIEEIRDTGNRSGFFGMFKSTIETMFKRSAKIEEMEKRPEDYELIIIGTPIWVGSIPSATKAYLEGNREKFRDVALLSVSGLGEKNDGAIAKFEALAGKKPIASLLLKAEDVKEGAGEGVLEGFVKGLEK